jgi:unsaturated rhamnogalacturonyl hydrolase
MTQMTQTTFEILVSSPVMNTPGRMEQRRRPPRSKKPSASSASSAASVASALSAAAIICVICGLSLDARQAPRTPLEIARVLAARYPENPIMSYIPAVAWSSSLRLARLTGDDKWKEKPRRDMSPFVTGATPAIAEPYLLTSLAGHFAFSDLGAFDGNSEATALARKAADFILADSSSAAAATPSSSPAAGRATGSLQAIIKFPRNWTDDMFMATSLLARVGAQTKDDRYVQAVGRLLTTYADTLQRPDGLFIHAIDGPHAWGRGNGFALLGLTEALTYLPETWSDRERVLAIYRKHVRALIAHQSDDGSWRQVVDEPTSYRELTVTAMTVAAMARGISRGWLDKDVLPIVERGWKAVVARVNDDGTVKDVCSGTGAGPTKEYYLNRPVVNGPDDRGGAMALLAAVEMIELEKR